MPSSTPVKVRGKKQNHAIPFLAFVLNPSPPCKRSSSPASSSPKSGKRIRYGTEASRPVRVVDAVGSASPLEKLPAELLEIIFLHSLNVSLPQSSLWIGRKLASHHVKSQLVYSVLSSPSTTTYPCDVATVFPTRKEQAEAQSAILRLRWLTLPFLRDLIPEFLIGTLVRELTARDIPWNGEIPVASPSFERSIRQHVLKNKSLNPANAQIPPVYRETNWIVDPALSKRLLETGNNGGEHEDWYGSDGWASWKIIVNHVHVGVGFEDGLVTLVHRNLCTVYNKWKIFCGIEGCRIPDKLLHGPWSDERCEFLELLLRGGASVDWVGSTSGEVANDGLLQALDERNAWAVGILLLGRHPRTRNLDHFYRYIPALNGVGVTATTEHLRIAVLQRGCPKDVVTLLMEASKSTIDPSDPVVNQWAYDCHLRGEEIGTWLLSELRRYEKSWKLLPRYEQ